MTEIYIVPALKRDNSRSHVQDLSDSEEEEESISPSPPEVAIPPEILPLEFDAPVEEGIDTRTKSGRLSKKPDFLNYSS